MQNLINNKKDFKIRKEFNRKPGKVAQCEIYTSEFIFTRFIIIVSCTKFQKESHTNTGNRIQNYIPQQ